MRYALVALILLCLSGCSEVSDNTKIIDVGNPINEVIWVKKEGTKCGTVFQQSSGLWIGYAYEDFSREHFFPNYNDAAYWVQSNWCHVSKEGTH